MSSEEDVHCDSLSGTTLGAAGLGVPASVRVPNEPRRVRGAPWLVAVALSGAVGFGLAQQRAPDQAPPEALHVEGRTVSYSPAFAEHAGLRTIEVREQPFSPLIVATGRVDFDQAHVTAISASSLGTVRRVLAYEGDRVRRGDTLAEVSSSAQAEREAAASFYRQKLPRATLGVSLLRSPLDGNVVERRIIEGQSVRGESIVFVIADLDRLSVTLSVDEAKSRGLGVGDRVELARDASADTLARGNVAELERPSSVEPASKLRVRVSVDNGSRALRAGQVVSARIFGSHAGRALLVPNRALAWIDGQPTVFVAASAHSASAAAVTLGGGDGEQTEVRFGLASGQRIVSDGVRTLQEASFL
ncbi:MAG TPA: efflux RND transporter periplasmic adaptor subunit [Polyangiaceae bacterium]|nr:efflux RND transporter periplasmic adaptor subunit [Polyangiaceae bacterium]